MTVFRDKDLLTEGIATVFSPPIRSAGLPDGLKHPQLSRSKAEDFSSRNGESSSRRALEAEASLQGSGLELRNVAYNSTVFEFTESSWLTRMFRANEYYFNSLSMDLASEPATVPLLNCFYANRGATMALIPGYLFTVCYQDTLRSQRSDEYQQLRSLSHQYINVAVNDPDRATDHNTIAAILMLSCFEVLQDGPEAKDYLCSLRDLYIQRGEDLATIGGMSGELRCPGLPDMVIALDLLSAATTNTSPVSLSVPPPSLRASSWPQNKKPVMFSSPLLMCEELISISLSDFPNLTPDILATLEGCFALIEILHLELIFPHHPAVYSFGAIRRATLHQLYAFEPICPPLNTAPTRDLVAEAVHLAAGIHFRAAANRIAHDDRLNRPDMEALHDLLHDHMDLDAWRGAPWVYFWVLLTACAAARASAQRPFLLAHLLRFAFSVGMRYNREFRQILLNFLWLQQVLRGEVMPGPGPQMPQMQQLQASDAFL